MLRSTNKYYNARNILEKLDCSRGAPMGRWQGIYWKNVNEGRTAYKLTETTELDVRVRLMNIPLDTGGYDCGGAYWGNPGDGTTLYGAFAPDSKEYEFQWFCWAYNRQEAYLKMKETYPNLRLLKPVAPGMA